jgi:hypothetical protein
MSKGRHDRSSSRLSLGEMIFDNSQAIPLKIPPGSQMSVTGMFRQLTRGPTKVSTRLQLGGMTHT